MGTDITSYLEFRDDAGAWQLLPSQPLDGVRSSTLFVLMGVPTEVALGIEIATFRPLVPTDRGLPADLSPALAAIWDEWRADAVLPGYLTLPELDAIDWRATFRVRDPELHDVAYEDWGGHLLGVAAQMRALGREARLVFWFDW